MAAVSHVRPGRAAWLAALSVVTASAVARGDDEFAGASVIFARGAALYQVDARGRGEVELAQLGAKVTVRALRTDAAGTVLLADLAGKWAWMPLDGSTKSLTELPCADGPAQLAEDGTSVLCRSLRSAARSVVVELPRGRGAKLAQPMMVDVAPASARLLGSGNERAVVWADAVGVWTAPLHDLKAKSRVAPDAPLRGFLASPDGARALGVYADEIYADVKRTRPAEVLMTLQLDGKGARRKAIANGVAVEWSRDAEWVLVQDGASACIMRAGGGQYKCWKGYTASSLASDGRWALAFGSRDGGKPNGNDSKPGKAAAGKPAASKPAAGNPSAPPPSAAKPRPDAPGTQPWDALGEPSDEPEGGGGGETGGGGEPATNDDVQVAPPTGPLSLYRLRLDGAFTDKPTLVVKVVDGAAVWVQKAP